MENIIYNFPRQHFLDVALQFMINRCPHLKFHFIFVDNLNKEFEDLCCTPEMIIRKRIAEFGFDRVIIYGSTTRAVKECIDVIARNGFVDRYALISF